MSTNGNTPVSATVIDISSSGLGFMSEEPIGIGEMACLDLGAGLVFGEIRHCEKDSANYRVGLRIEECLHCDAKRTPPKLGFLKAAHGWFKFNQKT